MRATSTAVALCLLIGLAAATAAQGQGFRFDGRIPRVSINDRSAELQASILPSLYEKRSARRDMQWVSRNDSALAAFWEQNSYTILHVLTDLSGIEWRESEFDIYLVRYFPSLGCSDPLVLPVGGIGDGVVTQLAPDGSRQALNLLFQLSRRMLAQANSPEDGVRLGITYHPLMRPGPHRADNLAMLLALATAEVVLGPDSTYDAYRSAFWVGHTPGRQVFETYLLGSWRLDPSRPLSQWISEEPYGSDLVLATVPPRLSGSEGGASGAHVEGLPLKGRLGMAAGINDQGRLVVDKLDPERLAHACGLQEGDEITRVEGRLVRSHREFVEAVLERWREGAATVEVIRDGSPKLVLLRPEGWEEEAGEFYGPSGFQPPYTPDQFEADSLNQKTR